MASRENQELQVTALNGSPECINHQLRQKCSRFRGVAFVVRWLLVEVQLYKLERSLMLQHQGSTKVLIYFWELYTDCKYGDNSSKARLFLSILLLRCSNLFLFRAPQNCQTAVQYLKYGTIKAL